MGEEKIQKRSLDIAEGDVINITQSTVRSVDGDHVELQQVGALSIDGERISIDQGASCVIKGENINLNQSIIGMAASSQLNMHSSLSTLTLSRDSIDIKDSASVVVAGRDVKAENVKTLFLAASRIEGNVRTIFDWRSALSFGAVLGGLIGLLALLRKR